MNVPQRRVTLIREASAVLIAAYLIAMGLHAYETYSPKAGPVMVGGAFRVRSARPWSGRELVLATSNQCPFSRKSLDFHRRIIRIAHRAGVRMLVIADDLSLVPREITSELSSQDQVLPTKLSDLVAGTPAILLVEGGRVAGRWIGILSSIQEDALTERIDGSVHTLTRIKNQRGELGEVVRFAPSDSSQSRGLSNATVLDLLPRDAPIHSRLPGAVNIPADELAPRMQIELPAGARVVVDCSNEEDTKCQASAALLVWAGFQDTWLYDVGTVGAACQSTPTGNSEK